MADQTQKEMLAELPAKLDATVRAVADLVELRTKLEAAEKAIAELKEFRKEVQPHLALGVKMKALIGLAFAAFAGLAVTWALGVSGDLGGLKEKAGAAAENAKESGKAINDSIKEHDRRIQVLGARITNLYGFVPKAKEHLVEAIVWHGSVVGLDGERLLVKVDNDPDIGTLAFDWVEASRVNLLNEPKKLLPRDRVKLGAKVAVFAPGGKISTVSLAQE